MIILIASRANGGASKAARQFSPDLDVSKIDSGCTFEYTFRSKYLGAGGQALCHFFAQEHTTTSAESWAAGWGEEVSDVLPSELAAFIYVYDNRSGIDPELLKVKAVMEVAGWTGTFLAVPLDGLDENSDSDLAYLVANEIGVVAFDDLVDSCLVSISETNGSVSGSLQMPEGALDIADLQPVSGSMTKNELQRDDIIQGQDSPQAVRSHQPITTDGCHSADICSDNENFDTLTQIYQQLQQARNSDMTNSEKWSLAETLSGKLVP